MSTQAVTVVNPVSNHPVIAALLNATPIIKSLEETITEVTINIANVLEREKSLPQEVADQLIGLIKILNPRLFSTTTEMVSEVKIPEIRMVQNSTVDRPANCNTGDLFTTGKVVLRQPFLFNVLYTYECNINYSDANILQCQAVDAQLGIATVDSLGGPCISCHQKPMGKFGSSIKTQCNNYACFFVIGHDGLIYEVRMAKTSRKTGSSLNDMVTQDPDKPFWKRTYQLTTAPQGSGIKNFHVFKASPRPEKLHEVFTSVGEWLNSYFRCIRHHLVNSAYAQAGMPRDNHGQPKVSVIDVPATNVISTPDTVGNPLDPSNSGL